MWRTIVNGTHAFRCGVLVVVLFSCWVAGSSQPAIAAAPRLIVVEGDLLRQPVLLDDWHENLELILAIQSGYENSPYQEADQSRPRLDILEYWLASEVEAVPRNVPDSRIGYWPETENGPALIGGHLAEAKASKSSNGTASPHGSDGRLPAMGTTPRCWPFSLPSSRSTLLAPLTVFAVKRRRTSTTRR